MRGSGLVPQDQCRNFLLVTDLEKKKGQETNAIRINESWNLFSLRVFDMQKLTMQFQTFARLAQINDSI